MAGYAGPGQSLIGICGRWWAALAAKPRWFQRRPLARGCFAGGAVKQARFVGGGPFDGDLRVLSAVQVESGFCDRPLPTLAGSDDAVARYLLAANGHVEAVFAFDRIHCPPAPPPG